jgi:hypothetical protein
LNHFQLSRWHNRVPHYLNVRAQIVILLNLPS